MTIQSINRESYDYISVIMSIYNEDPKWLRESIQSILEQTYSHFEFIIILDNPLNTKLESILNEYARKDSRIKLYKNVKNLGLVASLNLALSYISGDYVARMDADDISNHQRLEKQLHYLKENDLDIVGSNVEIFHDDITIGKTEYPHYMQDIYKALAFNNVFAHPTWFVKKNIFQELNGYRNISFAEDYDFLLRARILNKKMGNIKECLLQYRLSPDSISRTNLLEQKLTAYYLSKHCNSILSIEKEHIDDFISSWDCNQNKKNKYSKANYRISLAFKCRSNKNYFGYLFYLIYALITSFTFVKLVILIKYDKKKRIHNIKLK